ncbi:hypothetical protein [Pseudovibrio sp. WM33]|uniref:hypothetical protein n=1 Tax=Pseudovibrio sp. WM33 TaxID=1735585 RepID=UPI0007AE4184|nr:hypothetical protein [Pseudovibrio sp. WM33]KZL26066.1 hypothetical protein PsWM33_01591 [Pseudovibrio sp. WM33]
MKEFLESLPLRTLECDMKNPIASQLFRIWKARKGNLDQEFIQYTPHLLLSQTTQRLGDSPELLMIGRKTLARSAFGELWAHDTAHAKAHMPKRFCSYVAESYWSAQIHLKPQLDHIGTHISAATQQQYWCYTRLILPVITRTGIQLNLIYSRET